MNAPQSRWKKVLRTPISHLLRGRITGPQNPLEKLDTSSFSHSLVEAISAVTQQLSGRFQIKVARQLVNSCRTLLQEGCHERQLVEQLNEPESIAALIRVTRKTDWVLNSPLPARLWPTIENIVGKKRVRTSAARKMLRHVCRSFHWQLEAGRTPEELTSICGYTVALSGLVYETKSLGLLLDYDLPENLRSIVLDVVQRTRLWPNEKLDTAQELSAHFADGLEKGNTPEELIDSFGSPKTAARLIRRASLRNRPFAWQVRRRLWQAMALVLLLWVVLTIRFVVAMPTITFDLVQEVDDLSRAIPVQERAWPIYLQGLKTLAEEDRRELEKARGAMREGPKGKNWSKTKALLDKHADAIEIFLDATQRPNLGFINRPNHNDFQKNRELNRPYEMNPPNVLAVEISLPQTQDLATFVTPLLSGAIHLAAEQGDGERCLQLLFAQLSVASHYRQSGPFVICQISANGAVAKVAQLAEELVMEHPSLFNNSQLALLFEKLSEAKVIPLNFESSRRLFMDFIQKSYTDDGTGNGRFTARGLQILQRQASHFRDKKALFQSILPILIPNTADHSDLIKITRYLVLAAPVATMIADRKEMQAELLLLNELLSKQRTTAHTADPAVDSEYITEYRRLLDSPRLRLKYLPALILMPNEQEPTYWSDTPKHQVQHDAALVVIAAERYRRQHGQFPKTAKELVPAFLSEVPIDPYTNQPLRYSLKEGRPVIDSVGLLPPEEKH